MQDPVVSLLRQYRAAAERLPEGFCLVRSYWDIESGGIELDARSQTGLWREFTDAGIPRDGGMAELRAAIATGQRPFSAVICEHINRAGRDMLDSLPEHTRRRVTHHYGEVKPGVHPRLWGGGERASAGAEQAAELGG